MAQVTFTVAGTGVDGKIPPQKKFDGFWTKVVSLISDPDGLLAPIKRSLYFSSMVEMPIGAQKTIELDNYKLSIKVKIIDGKTMKLYVLQHKNTAL
jgi:hypothetical protein